MTEQEEINALPDKYKPISPWGYLGYTILFSIPTIGFIFLIIFALNGSNINRRNFARSYWIPVLLATIAIIVLIVIAVVGGGGLAIFSKTA